MSHTLIDCTERTVSDTPGQSDDARYFIPGPRNEECLVACTWNAVAERKARDGPRVAFVQLQRLPRLRESVCQ